jgi:hypothetical protein
MTSQPKDANLIWLVLHIFCLAALVGLTLLPTTTAAQSNPVVLENQQPGTTQWQIPWGSSATDSAGQIKGYASAVSVNKGQNITFYVSVNPAQTYTMDVYRMGWYQGLGGRLVQHIGPLNGTLQPACPTDATTGMIECQWASAYTLATQSSWNLCRTADQRAEVPELHRVCRSRRQPSRRPALPAARDDLRGLQQLS